MLKPFIILFATISTVSSKCNVEDIILIHTDAWFFNYYPVDATDINNINCVFNMEPLSYDLYVQHVAGIDPVKVESIQCMNDEFRYNISGYELTVTKGNQIRLGCGRYDVFSLVMGVVLLMFLTAIFIIICCQIRNWTAMRAAAHKEVENGRAAKDPSRIRRDGRKKLLFSDLSVLTADAMCPYLIVNFGDYSVHERRAFSENMINEFLQSYKLSDFVSMFMHILYKETDYIVLKNFIAGFKMMAISCRANNDFLPLEYIKRFFHAVLMHLANLIIHKYGYHQLISDTDNVKNVRGLALHLFDYFENEDNIGEMIKIFEEQKLTLEAPLRRTVWACVARQGGEYFTTITKWLFAEASKTGYIRKDKLVADLCYALCAADETTDAAPLLSIICTQPIFTAQDVVAAFTAMVEDYDECIHTARFIFTDRHKAISERFKDSIHDYKNLFKMFARYAFFAPGKKEWLLELMTDNVLFTTQSREELDLNLLTQYGAIHATIESKVHELPELLHKYKY